MLGKEAIIFKALTLSGKHGRRCGGHKREGECALSGEVCQLEVSLSIFKRGCDELTEVSRGHSSLPVFFLADEGLNMQVGLGNFNFDDRQDADKED